MKSLQEIWQELADKGYKTDKGDVHSYLPVYEEILQPYRDKDINVLEIGLFNGHSMRMWEEYFTKAKVYGIDCDEQPHSGLADLRPMIEEGGHNIIIGDATNEEDIKKNFGGLKFSIIIDDGNHQLDSIQKSYSILKDYLAPGGLYIIEDLEPKNGVITLFDGIDPDAVITILDRRHLKLRFDDILALIQHK